MPRPSFPRPGRSGVPAAGPPDGRPPRVRRRGPFLQQLAGALLLLLLFAAAAHLPSRLAQQVVEGVRQAVPVDQLDLRRLRTALERVSRLAGAPAGGDASRPVEGGSGGSTGSGSAPASGGSAADAPSSFLAMVAPGGERAELVGTFGWRRAGEVVHFVPGVDWRLPAGAPVRAAAAGQVVQVQRHGPLGDAVRVASSGGWTLLYARLGSIRVGVGQRVRAGQVIATAGTPSGERGANLYLQVERKGEPVDPLVLLRVGGRG
ncbi:MAG: M23 family metallopeptidase [Bacillota bacterium]|nr:M23 family metallopeptidase [Bacillota bacterium]